MMEEGEYQIIETPEEQFILRHKNAQYGPFKSKAIAEARMRLVINPVVYHYDVSGKELT